MKKNNADRRSFIKNAAFLGFGVPASLTSISKAQANTNNKIDQATDSNEANTQAENEFSIFITTDLHAQIHTHDEFFWENGKAVYKKRG
jgi:S-sulfosulfanyl-L-cysteine sulfohydrolase